MIQGVGGINTVREALGARNNKRLKILFFHNTLPEYRIGWFQKLSELADVEFVFTNKELNKKNYGFDIEYERIKGLKYTFLSGGQKGIHQLKSILANVSGFDFVELPPMDSFYDIVCGMHIVRECKKNYVKIGYFWEKWDAPKAVQPIKRRIKNLILRIIPKVIYKHSNVIFAVGKKSKEYFISNGIDEKKIAVIPDVSETPPCEHFDIKKRYDIPFDKNIIMYLGRVMPQKGVRCLIDAFCGMEEQSRRSCHLLIAGDGKELGKCKKIVRKCGIENITFTGAVEPGKRGNYFSQCDIFVYPVTYHRGSVDVWGLTLNEAVQHGKIVIATDAVGSAFELIKEGINGYRVKPGNVQEMREALQKALDPRVAQNAIEKNRELIKIFNFRNMAKQYIYSVQRLLKKGEEEGKDDQNESRLKGVSCSR